MRANYLGQGRPDIQFACNELAGKNNSLDENDWQNLKRMGRFLKGKPRVVQVFHYNPAVKDAKEVSVMTDTDHAGCIRTRRSTTGIVLRAGSHVVRTQSSTQSAISLSSGESEFCGILKGSSAGLGLRSCLEDFG
eukprot:14500606-Heterocapsa_arctica.AAC.1